MNIQNIAFKKASTNNQNVTTRGQIGKVNWSDIMAKLIRLAAQHTECYASDLLYDINAVEKYLANPNQSLQSFYFGFRQCGVDGADYIALRYEDGEMGMYRALYRLDVKRDDAGYIDMELSQISV